MVESIKNGLSYDTEILVWTRGTYKAFPIETIVEAKSKCYVYTANEDGTYSQEIKQWHDRGEQEVFEYTLDNGATIKATKDHKFMTADGQMLPIDEIFERGLDLREHKPYIVDGYDFKLITPDRYHCPARYGNHCHFNIIKFDSSYITQNDGCTEGFRISNNDELNRLEATKDYETGFNNWMLSYNISFFYDENNYSCFFLFVNDCINGYRNITYVKQQQAIDNSFTSEEEKTPKHTYISLNNAIQLSIQLYKYLQDSNKFDEMKLLSFSGYLRSRCFNNPYRKFSGGVEHIACRKEIFDYIITNNNKFEILVTDEMIEEFQQQYKIYQEDAKKYADKTIEERRDRLN